MGLLGYGATSLAIEPRHRRARIPRHAQIGFSAAVTLIIDYPVALDQTQ